MACKLPGRVSMSRSINFATDHDALSGMLNKFATEYAAPTLNRNQSGKQVLYANRDRHTHGLVHN